MYMFLPFLIALGTALIAMWGRKRPSYVFWVVLLLVTLATFKHHATDHLTLMF